MSSTLSSIYPLLQFQQMIWCWWSTKIQLFNPKVNACVFIGRWYVCLAPGRHFIFTIQSYVCVCCPPASDTSWLACFLSCKTPSKCLFCRSPVLGFSCVFVCLFIILAHKPTRRGKRGIFHNQQQQPLIWLVKFATAEDEIKIEIFYLLCLVCVGSRAAADRQSSPSITVFHNEIAKLGLCVS